MWDAAARRDGLMNFTPGRVIAAIVVLVAGGGYYYWQHRDSNALPPGFARGNGRIEAVEIDIATKTPGRIREILANEGDFVSAGQVLARMDTEQLQAQRRQAARSGKAGTPPAHPLKAAKKSARSRAPAAAGKTARKKR